MVEIVILGLIHLLFLSGSLVIVIVGVMPWQDWKGERVLYKVFYNTSDMLEMESGLC